MERRKEDPTQSSCDLMATDSNWDSFVHPLLLAFQMGSRTRDSITENGPLRAYLDLLRRDRDRGRLVYRQCINIMPADEKDAAKRVRIFLGRFARMSLDDGSCGKLDLHDRQIPRRSSVSVVMVRFFMLDDPCRSRGEWKHVRVRKPYARFFVSAKPLSFMVRVNRDGRSESSS